MYICNVRKILLNIISISFLVVFLTPTAIQFFHSEHEHFKCNAQHEKHFHEKHENCKICDFSFSVYQQQILKLKIEKIHFHDILTTNYISKFFHQSSTLNFFLRAPPSVI